MTKMMKKLVTIAVLAVTMVLASCSNITGPIEEQRLADKFTNYELLHHYSQTWEEAEELNDAYMPSLGQTYTKECMDAPYDHAYIKEIAGPKALKLDDMTECDDQYSDVYIFKAIRFGEEYYPTFYEYEPRKYMLLTYGSDPSYYYGRARYI
jgi:hypothetical protein